MLPQFSLVFLRFFISFFVIENAVIDMTTQVIMENIAPLHIFQIKKDLLKSMQPILRYSKNNKQLFWMVPKWLTSYLASYVINQWSTAFGPISNPLVFVVLYLVKYYHGFRYFISHDIKNRFKNTVTLPVIQSQTPKVRFFDSERMAHGNLLIFTALSLHCEKELILHFFRFFWGVAKIWDQKKNYIESMHP